MEAATLAKITSGQLVDRQFNAYKWISKSCLFWHPTLLPERESAVQFMGSAALVSSDSGVGMDREGLACG